MTFLTATMLRDAAISFPMLGDWSIDPPYSFTVFGFEIYFYGAIIALGFILAALFCAKQAAKFGLTSDDLFDFVIWLIPTCIIGARLYYVLFKLDYFLANPSEILSLRDGGLAIYGGIIAGVITGVLVCKRKKIPVLALGDLAAFGLLIGQAIGRWGNFINREAFGVETDIFCRRRLNTPAPTALRYSSTRRFFTKACGTSRGLSYSTYFCAAARESTTGSLHGCTFCGTASAGRGSKACEPTVCISAQRISAYRSCLRS